jgi:hypothetical protein
MNQLTQQTMEELCRTVPNMSAVNQIDIDTKDHANKIIGIHNKLKDAGKIPKHAQVFEGVKGYEVDNGIKLYTVAAMHPFDKDEKGTPYAAFPMTGVFTHCYDPKRGLYLFQVRGQHMKKGAGQVQTAGCGFGMYRKKLSDVALTELKEESHLDGKLEMCDDLFLDITPFMLAGYPQLMFSFITKDDLSDISNGIDRNNISDIEKIANEVPQTEEAGIFVAPLKELRQITKEIDSKIGMYGPVQKTVNSFVNWYEKQ